MKLYEPINQMRLLYINVFDNDNLVYEGMSEDVPEEIRKMEIFKSQRNESFTSVCIWWRQKDIKTMRKIYFFYNLAYKKHIFKSNSL